MEPAPVPPALPASSALAVPRLVRPVLLVPSWTRLALPVAMSLLLAASVALVLPSMKAAKLEPTLDRDRVLAPLALQELTPPTVRLSAASAA